MREKLLGAARRAIVEHGLTSVRIRDVADAAGTAAGTVSYYFPEVDKLFEAVYEDAVERFCAERWRAIESIADPRERMLVTIRSGLPSGPDDELACLLYEFSPHARRRRLEAVLRSSLFMRQVAIYRSIVDSGVAAGVFDPVEPVDTICHNLVALEDAYGYHVVVGSAVSAERAEAFLRSYAAVATRCDLEAAALSADSR
jgi:AcrR family transcriptional regulator